MGDLEGWCGEVEISLAAEEFGNDLASVKSLSKSHGVLESVLAANTIKLKNLGKEFIRV